MKNQIRVLIHSSIRISGNAAVIYVDPFKLKGEPHDADYIFVTHDHYDHFSPEDIGKAAKEGTILVVPESMRQAADRVSNMVSSIISAVPGESGTAGTVHFQAVPAYNNTKQFHPKAAAWVGYVLDLDGGSVYIAGDTDMNADNVSVKCDTALVPIGGKFTMNAEEAARFVNRIRPKTAIPTHYGCIIGSREDAGRFAKDVDSSIRVETLMEEFD